MITPRPSPDPNEDTGHYLVHRWTAAALIKHTDAEELTDAHRRAAQFWQWRVYVWPQDRTVDIQQLIEARYHHRQAHDLDNAVPVTGRICEQLHTWGAWAWEEDLYNETLNWLPPRSAVAAAVIHQLGMIAEERGDYTQAEQRYQTALTINKELGNQAGISISYQQLGIIARIRGDYAQAERRCNACLAIQKALGDRVGIATSYHQLGITAQLRGDYPRAEQHYQTALTIDKELGNRAGIAASYGQLGSIAELRGDYAQAEQHHQTALAINEKLGNRAGIAAGYGQLGIVAQELGDYAQAEQHYQASLIINEKLGNRADIATVKSQLGTLRTKQGRPVEGIPYNISALAIRLELESAEVSADIF